MNDICKVNKRKYVKSKMFLHLYQLLLVCLLVFLWELLTHYNILNKFLFSSPSEIFTVFKTYLGTNELFKHIYISTIEVILGVVIGSTLGILIASILWYFDFLKKLLNPFLTILNALPKTALAPIMIIWAGTSIKGIVVVCISILIIVTILSTLSYFNGVETEKIKLMKVFKASKLQIYTKLILPSNIKNLISIVKINIGLGWVGVIVGEFIVSRSGIGYLIMYGGMVFRLDLVMMGVIVLSILALLMTYLIDLIEKLMFNKKKEGKNGIYKK